MDIQFECTLQSCEGRVWPLRRTVGIMGIYVYKCDQCARTFAGNIRSPTPRIVRLSRESDANFADIAVPLPEDTQGAI